MQAHERQDMMRRALILATLLLCTTLIGTTSVAASTAARTMRVKLYFIAENDNGKLGIRGGCHDSVMAVDRVIQVSTTPLEDTIKSLISIKDQYYGRAKLYNALYSSKLYMVGVVINRAGIVYVSLNGKLGADRGCELERIKSQLEQTSLQFSNANKTVIYVNGSVLGQPASYRK